MYCHECRLLNEGEPEAVLANCLSFSLNFNVKRLGKTLMTDQYVESALCPKAVFLFWKEGIQWLVCLMGTQGFL